MNSERLKELVNAVLYEGYLLYPYRPSSKKNKRERFTFGRVYPKDFSLLQTGAEPCVMQTECLVRWKNDCPTLSVSIGFLQPIAREIAEVNAPARELIPGTEPALAIVPELRVGDELFQSWHEAIERKVTAPRLELTVNSPAMIAVPFLFCSSHDREPVRDANGSIAGIIVRRQETVEGKIEISAQPIEPRVCKVTVRILNNTSFSEVDPSNQGALLLRTFASTHTILNVAGGEFISLMDPPPEYKRHAEACKNIGAWPVLVGDEERHQSDTMLSSPIILYDYPKIAPESAGDLFDATEIDEILTLRMMTMTEEEKREMSRVDQLARRLLERTEALAPASLLQMHGTMRKAESATAMEFDDFFGAHTSLKSVTVGGVNLQAGDRVRLRPKARADVLDLALNGQTAVIEAVEQDLEKRVHLAVVLDEDPGKDLGLLRQPGHRFFYGVDEVEPLKETVP